MTDAVIDKLITDFKEKSYNSIPRDPRFLQLGLTQIIRTLDFKFIEEFIFGKKVSEMGELYDLGIHNSVVEVLGQPRKVHSYALKATNENLSNWAHSLIQNSGKIALLKLNQDYKKYGLVNCNLEEKKIIFTSPLDYIPIELIERLDWHQYQLKSKKHFDTLASTLISEHGQYIRSELRKIVDVYMGHYIQYSSTPEIDIFFHALAEIKCKSLIHSELFNPSTNFGGVKFGKYIEAITRMMGFSIKHSWASRELLLKRPKLRLENLVTYTTSINELIRDLSTCLDVDYKDAEIIMNNICLDETNLKSFTDSFLPPLVRISSGVVLRSLKGSQDNPFAFVMRELRRKHVTDWDKSVDEREVRFRENLCEVFSLFKHIVACKDAFILKDQKRTVTDIDAAFFDKKNGSLVLIQLKWQDPFNNFGERYSRKTNFIKNGNKWVENVSDWLTGNDKAALIKKIYKGPENIGEVRKIHLFVVGRYFSDFSGVDERDSRAAWTNWARFVELVDRNKNKTDFHEDVFGCLFREIKDRKRLIIGEHESVSVVLQEFQINFPTLEVEKILLKCK